MPARANSIVNQVLNAAAPAAVGRSVLVDPQGNVRVERLLSSFETRSV